MEEKEEDFRLLLARRTLKESHDDALQEMLDSFDRLLFGSQTDSGVNLLDNVESKLQEVRQRKALLQARRNGTADNIYWTIQNTPEFVLKELSINERQALARGRNPSKALYAWEYILYRAYDKAWWKIVAEEQRLERMIEQAQRKPEELSKDKQKVRDKMINEIFKRTSRLMQEDARRLRAREMEEMGELVEVEELEELEELEEVEELEELEEVEEVEVEEDLI